MNCPECGAPVGADEKFCGNCGTPIQDLADTEKTNQDQPNLEEQSQDTVEEVFEQDATQEEETPSQWESVGEETIYSEPTQLPEAPMPLPVEEPFVPDPAGLPEEFDTPAQQPPTPASEATASSKNKKLIIAIIVAIVLLLCCCIAAVAAIVLLAMVGESDTYSMLVPSLMAVL
jgi:hypothetical protein